MLEDSYHVATLDNDAADGLRGQPGVRPGARPRRSRVSAMDVPAPSGRRDNGLQSADWGALVDLDPRLSEALLSSLASADVPAFVEPAGDLNAWTRAAQLPDRPLHRLWVDPSKADTARTVVAKEVEDLSALLAEREPGATAHGFVQAVPRSAAARVLRPPQLPDPPGRAAEAPSPADGRPSARSYRPPPEPPPHGPRPGTDRRRPPRGAGRRTGPADRRRHRRGVAADRRRLRQGGRGSRSRRGRCRRTSSRAGPACGRPARSARPTSPPRRRRTDPRPEPVAPLPDWVEPEAVEDDGHYVPPPPPPVPRLAPRKLAAALALLAGVLLMIDPGLLLQPATTGWRTFGVLLTVGRRRRARVAHARHPAGRARPGRRRGRVDTPHEAAERGRRTGGAGAR